MKSRIAILLLFSMCVVLSQASTPSREGKIYHFSHPLYGAAYYAEYAPTDRLDEDIRLMKEAGLNVVRIGESTWSLFEPQDGQFEFAWMDRIIDHMHKAGIKVILGTPTYSIPAWMAAEHPEVLAHTTKDEQRYYGMRQNMDLKNPTYLRYSERIIRKLMERYAKHPAVIGYQVDNEADSRFIDNKDYFEGFKQYIRDEFNDDLKELNRRWGLNFWGMNINKWEDFYDRKGVTNPSYKIWWERWNRKVLADFINWQIDIVNEYRRPEQFVMHCFMPYLFSMDQVEAFRQMDYPAVNIYYDRQDRQDGMKIAYFADFVRPIANNHNFICTETTAQTSSSSSRYQNPPYDGQLRQNMYAFFANGANMVAYWHWASNHYGAETYCRGLIGHDQLPSRVYYEFQRNAAELERIGSQLVNIKKRNRVAMLFSHDSKYGLEFMPYTDNNYDYQDYMIYEALYKQNIECDIISVDKRQDFTGYDVLIIPPLYIASDELLLKISEFVRQGGEVVMCWKSGYADLDSYVRPVVAPGPLTDVCGFTYNEYSTIGTLPLKPNAIGATDNTVNTWIEFLRPTTATPLAYADHPFFGQWPCITENSYGRGHLIYMGAIPSKDILRRLINRAVDRKGILQAERQYQFPIIFRSGTTEKGHPIHYIFNFSAEPLNVDYPYDNSTSLLDSAKLSKGQSLTVEPWGVVIAVEK